MTVSFPLPLPLNHQLTKQQPTSPSLSHRPPPSLLPHKKLVPATLTTKPQPSPSPSHKMMNNRTRINPNTNTWINRTRKPPSMLPFDPATTVSSPRLAAPYHFKLRREPRERSLRRRTRSDHRAMRRRFSSMDLWCWIFDREGEIISWVIQYVGVGFTISFYMGKAAA